MKTLSLITLSLLSLTSAFGQWNTFHGNNQRNGLTTAVAAPQPQTKWTYDIGGPIICSPVVAPDGSIIVGATWNDKSKPTLSLTAVRPNGTLKWRFDLPWIDDETIATPAIGTDGRVYFGTPTGMFYCVDSNGIEQWKHQSLEPVKSHAMVGQDGNVYVQLDGKLTSFTPNGQKRWERSVDYNNEMGPSETLDGKILATGNGVYCYNSNGTLLWHALVITTLAPVAVSPNGDIIVGGSDVVALNPANGDVKWRAGISAYGTFASPAIDLQGNIYYGFDYDTYKIGPNGNILVHKMLQAPDSNMLGHTYSSPLIDGAGKIYWGLGQGKRSAIEFEKNLLVLNSAMQWTYLAPFPEITGTSNPAIAPDGTLYIGCLDGKLYALGS